AVGRYRRYPLLPRPVGGMPSGRPACLSLRGGRRQPVPAAAPGAKPVRAGQRGRGGKLAGARVPPGGPHAVRGRRPKVPAVLPRQPRPAAWWLARGMVDLAPRVRLTKAANLEQVVEKVVSAQDPWRQLPDFARPLPRLPGSERLVLGDLCQTLWQLG